MHLGDREPGRMSDTGKGARAGDDEVVNWDGVLSPQERQRILARLRSALGAVGSRIPDIEVIDQKRVPLKDIVFGYLGKPSLTQKELEEAGALARALERKVKALEGNIRDASLSERAAVDLMREALGLLRALYHLRGLTDEGRVRVARKALMARVDDERRWLEFIKKVKL